VLLVASRTFDATPCCACLCATRVFACAALKGWPGVRWSNALRSAKEAGVAGGLRVATTLRVVALAGAAAARLPAPSTLLWVGATAARDITRPLWSAALLAATIVFATGRALAKAPAGTAVVAPATLRLA
jgi:hypothetical protein